METVNDSGIGDSAALEFSLNSAQWEVGVCIVPTCSGSSDDANSDDSEVSL